MLMCFFPFFPFFSSSFFFDNLHPQPVYGLDPEHVPNHRGQKISK